MAGLDPAIHVLLAVSAGADERHCGAGFSALERASDHYPQA
jgi:hypothetical protein